MNYSEQLKHPKWQRRRLEVLQAMGFACEQCRVEDKTLHVHHRRYVKGRMVWEYPDVELTVLCEDCHQQYHEWKELLDELLAIVPTNEIGSTTAMFGGILESLGYSETLIEKIGGASGLAYYAGNAMGLTRRAYYGACKRGLGDEFWQDLAIIIKKYAESE